MKKFKININSFKLGEAKEADLQNDSNLYYMGAKKLVNFIPRNNNILTRRPGTKYITTLDVAEIGIVKLITVDFVEDSYLLLFTKSKLQIYKTTTKAVRKVSEINTPYKTDTNINSLNYALDNSNDAVFLFCEGAKPQILTKTGDNNFALTELQFSDGPYGDINKTDTTLNVYEASGDNIIVEASADVFFSSDVGRHLRIFDEENKTWGWAMIAEYTNATQVKVNIKKAIVGRRATKFWRKGVFGIYNYPKLGTVFGSRLYLANAASGKDQSKVWASCYNDFLNFAPTTNQEEFNIFNNAPDTVTYGSAITFAVSEVKKILWLTAAPQYVILGSHEGIFALMPLDFNKSLSPFNFIIQKITNHNSTKVIAANSQFVFYGNTTNNLNVLEYIYDNISPKAVSNILPFNTTAASSNKILQDTVLSFGSENIITILFSNGEIAFVAINQLEKEIIYAFSEVALGGNKAMVKAITANNNFLYLIVTRNINNKEQATLERINWQDLNTSLQDSISLKDLEYLDCTEVLEYANPTTLVEMKSNNPTAVITDNYYLGEFCLESGGLTLQIPALRVVKGYNFCSSYQSFSVNDMIHFSTFSGYKKLQSITIGFINSLGGRLGAGDNYIINNLAGFDLEAMSNNFFTGYRNFKTSFPYKRELSLNLSQNTPHPFNVNLCNLELLNT